MWCDKTLQFLQSSENLCTLVFLHVRSNYLLKTEEVSFQEKICPPLPNVMDIIEILIIDLSIAKNSFKNLFFFFELFQKKLDF